MFFNPVGGYQPWRRLKKRQPAKQPLGLKATDGVTLKITTFTKIKIQLEVYRIWI
jgi:hypothetical protein